MPATLRAEIEQTEREVSAAKQRFHDHQGNDKVALMKFANAKAKLKKLLKQREHTRSSRID
jgi:hypothetical protein